jgi:charged multivesicular body protein 2A
MTPAERLRKHQRALEKTQRELDRERTKLENQEKKLVQEIKKNAKNGQMGAVKVQAKDLVRTRRYIQKFYQMRTQLQAISLRIQTVRSNEQMMQSMKGATKLLGSMNKQMNLPALQRIAMEFEKENDIMDQRQEMMDDAIDDVTGLEDEEEGEDVVNQVLDEIGVDLGQSVSSHCSCGLSIHVANEEYSSARHRKACRARRSRRARSRKLLVVVAAAPILAMMISKRASTVYEDEMTLMRHERSFCIPILRPNYIRLSGVDDEHVIVMSPIRALRSTSKPPIITTSTCRYIYLTVHVPRDTPTNNSMIALNVCHK